MSLSHLFDTSAIARAESDDLPPHLEFADPRAFEIGRRRSGKRWRFYLRKGNVPITAKSQMQRLEDIAVPATWTRVRMTLDPRTHIRAMGYDGSGKLQYLYHEDYLEYRNLRKFAELPAFGLALPRIRRRIKRDLAANEWDENRLLALMVRILDRYHLRVGTRLYATTNQTFGLTTLRKRHLKEGDSGLVFEYVAKAGQPNTVCLTDPALVTLVREVAEFPGWELFSIRKGSRKIMVTPARINDYIRDAAGDRTFSARTFRTWGATVLAVKLLEQARRQVALNPRRELPAVLTELVAERLGNTPAICRQYYIHPDVFAAVTADDFDPVPDNHNQSARLYRQHERRALEILTQS